MASGDPTFWGSLGLQLKDWISVAFHFLLAHLWGITTGALVIALLLFVIRPFDSDPIVTVDEVAENWNGSIERLGLSPVFPPTEDIYVGDIWAVIANSADKRILRKSVRIAHIDMKDQIILAGLNGPLFSETPMMTKEKEYRPLDRKEVVRTDTDKITLSLSAFPGITISRTKRARGTIGATFGWLGGSRDEEENEEIRIPVAESYGVSSTDAIVRLINWCKEEKTKAFCQDKLIRQEIAYSLGKEVLSPNAQSEYAKIELVLISRVFLMREINHRIRSSVARGASFQVGSNSQNCQSVRVTSNSSASPAQPPPDVAAQNEARVNNAAQVPDLGATNATRSACIASGAGSEIQLKEVFQRPLAFGFRSVNLALTPAQTLGKESP